MKAEKKREVEQEQEAMIEEEKVDKDMEIKDMKPRPKIKKEMASSLEHKIEKQMKPAPTPIELW